MGGGGGGEIKKKRQNEKKKKKKKIYKKKKKKTKEKKKKEGGGGGGDSALHTYIYDHYRYVKVYVYSNYYDIRTKFIDAGYPSQKAIRFCKNTYKV